MNIIIANKFYYNRGGDCIYSIGLEKMLKEAGHNVAFFSMNYSKNFESEWSSYWVSEFSFKKFMRPFGDKETKIKFTKLLDDFKPDIAHLNNIHTQISPVIAEIAHNRGVKVIWTLHDHKLLCPSYLCLNGKGEICEKCFGDKKSHCAKNRCMKNKILHSFIAQKEAEKWNREHLEKCVDSFICPSDFMKQKMMQGGFIENKLKVIHNFIDIPQSYKSFNQENHCSDYYAYIGRLSKEKGLDTLCSVAAKLPYKLKIAGSGNIENELKEKYRSCKQIEFLGYQNRESVLRIVENAKFIVVPSEWYEIFGLVVIEALCLGTPVLGANIGAIPELIEEGRNGELFESRNLKELEHKITEMQNKKYDFNFAEYQKKFSRDNYCQKLMKVFDDEKF